MWSLCCTLVEWFNSTGTLWSTRDVSPNNQHRVIKEIKTSRPVGLDDMQPHWVKDVLKGGFNQDPKQRPTAEGLRDSFKTQQGLLNFFFFFYYSFILLCLESRTGPILTLYDGRCQWDSNLHTLACELPALPLCLLSQPGQPGRLYLYSLFLCVRILF